jgi:hypothetical protein
MQPLFLHLCDQCSISTHRARVDLPPGFQVLHRVVGALSDDLSLPLTHTDEQIHHQFTRRGRRIQTFLQAHESDVYLLEAFHEVTEIHDAPSEPVELSHHHHPCLSLVDDGQQSLKARTDQ